MIILGD